MTDVGKALQDSLVLESLATKCVHQSVTAAKALGRSSVKLEFKGRTASESTPEGLRCDLCVVEYKRCRWAGKDCSVHRDRVRLGLAVDSDRHLRALPEGGRLFSLGLAGRDDRLAVARGVALCVRAGYPLHTHSPWRVLLLSTHCKFSWEFYLYSVCARTAGRGKAVRWLARKLASAVCCCELIAPWWLLCRERRTAGIIPP